MLEETVIAVFLKEFGILIDFKIRQIFLYKEQRDNTALQICIKEQLSTV